MSVQRSTVLRLQEAAQDRHIRLESERIAELEAEAAKPPVRTYGAVYVTVGRNGKPRFHHFWRGRLWPISRVEAEASFAAGATVYRKQPGVSIWQEGAVDVFVG